MAAEDSCWSVAIEAIPEIGVEVGDFIMTTGSPPRAWVCKSLPCDRLTDLPPAVRCVCPSEARFRGFPEATRVEA